MVDLRVVPVTINGGAAIELDGIAVGYAYGSAPMSYRLRFVEMLEALAEDKPDDHGYVSQLETENAQLREKLGKLQKELNDART